MNIDKRMLQLSQRREKLLPKLEKLLCRVRSPDYLSKAPAHVRQQMDTKVSAAMCHHWLDIFYDIQYSKAMGNKVKV